MKEIQMIDRTKFIGGSDLAGILGISKWISPYQLYLQKIGELIRKETQEKLDFFERRKLAEPYVLSIQEYHDKIIPVHVNRRFYDEKFPFLSSEIDFEYEDKDFGNSIQNGEIKTISPYDYSGTFGEELTNEIPNEYLCQAMHNLGVTGREKCRMIVMGHWDDYRRYEIYRDEELIEMLRNRAIEFWQRIQDRNPPPPVTVGDFNLRKPMLRSITATTDMIQLVEKIKKYKGYKKDLESFEEDLKLYIGDYEGIITELGTQLATWKQQKSSSGGLTRVLRIK